jgi:hypothetical protein
MPTPVGSGLPNEASYADLGETVHDDVTCLEWQKEPPEETRDWVSALDYCSELTLGGSSDWRLPTRIELTSIVTYDNHQGFDPVFPAWDARGIWTASAASFSVANGDPPGQGEAWAWFVDGLGYDLQSAKRYVRCVRGGGAGEEPTSAAVAPANQYSEPAPGEIRDNYTGLTWQQDQSNTLIAHADAAAYCPSLTLGGHTWRTPSVQELLTLVDEARAAPAINTEVFPDTEWETFPRYWVSTNAGEPSGSNGVCLTFADGILSSGDVSGEDGRVKCVR